MFQVSDIWKATYPNAHVGVLVMREVINPPVDGSLRFHPLAGLLRADMMLATLLPPPCDPLYQKIPTEER